MSVLTSAQVTSPYNKTEACAQIGINDLREQFTFENVTAVGTEYTLSFWVKSASAGTLIIAEQTISTTTAWTRFTYTFTAQSTDLTFDFGSTGTYYIYHMQLEIGNKATGWTMSHEDIEDVAEAAKASANAAQGTADEAHERILVAESIIRQLADQISMLVTDGNNKSLMTQTANGWTFRIQSIQDAVNSASAGVNSLRSSLGDTDHTVDVLQRAVNDLEGLSEYINISVYQGEPCIELGETDSDFKLMITNTRIMFMEGGNTPTYISNEGLITENITVTNEFRHGDFVWAVRSNGNYGLVWKGS